MKFDLTATQAIEKRGSLKDLCQNNRIWVSDGADVPWPFVTSMNLWKAWGSSWVPSAVILHADVVIETGDDPPTKELLKLEWVVDIQKRFHKSESPPDPLQPHLENIERLLTHLPERFRGQMSKYLCDYIAQLTGIAESRRQDMEAFETAAAKVEEVLDRLDVEIVSGETEESEGEDGQERE
jgi:hypothetical protein